MSMTPAHSASRDGEQTMHAAAWGPFDLVSPQPIDLHSLDRGDADAWCQVGLWIDPPSLAHDYNRVLRQIRAFMGYVESVTGYLWEVRPESLAVRNFLAREPVVLPFWRDMDVGES